MATDLQPFHYGNRNWPGLLPDPRAVLNDPADPRVLFAAERTLLAWSRTAAGYMAIGFLIDRSSLVVAQESASRSWALAIGMGFVLLGVVLSGLSVIQYRRALASLRPADIPAGYWVNLSVCVTAVVGLLGVVLASYLALT